MSDIIQNTLLDVFYDLEQIQTLDAVGRKRMLRRMLVNNLLQEIDRWRAGRRDYRLEKALERRAAESSIRLQNWLVAEDTSPSEQVVCQEEGVRLLEASKLDPRQRETPILQRYHGWTLAQIAQHLGCTTGAVAGLHARGLTELRKHLPEME